MDDIFRRFAAAVSTMVGSVWAFVFVVGVVLGTGFYFRFSGEWKINVGFIATITSLLVLIFLQKSQNHSDKATHLKLDELIRAVEGARDEVASAEQQAEREMNKLKEDAREA